MKGVIGKIFFLKGLGAKAKPRGGPGASLYSIYPVYRVERGEYANSISFGLRGLDGLGA